MRQGVKFVISLCEVVVHASSQNDLDTAVRVVKALPLPKKARSIKG
jgi:hypothetical protein